MGYGLVGRRVGVRIPDRACDFLFSVTSRLALRPAHPPIQWALGVPSTGIKRQEHEADHSPLLSRSRMVELYSYLQPPHVSMGWCLIFCLFFYYYWGGTKSLGTAATSCLLYKPQMIDEDDCGAIGGMKIGRGNRSTRRKPAPAPLCPPQNPT
jgi:hypothetical protein